LGEFILIFVKLWQTFDLQCLNETLKTRWLQAKLFKVEIDERFR
jgi:hypothetical protein